ncbi:hypothetical protein DCAR_0518480 [Daucus carota subsp. sativus]|uniref:Uncharacterized protein n=1 Tax=Daucus carota subsp. sativus TaxID=79200 RepID=A0A164X9W3_DAUCS|nr:hypothetical protein DCAR_0518480 [Daucus carota subsp. sativus]
MQLLNDGKWNDVPHMRHFVIINLSVKLTTVLDEEEYLQLQEGEWEVEVDEAALVGGEEAAEAAAMVDAGVLAADDPLAID